MTDETNTAPPPPANASEARGRLDARIADKSWGERLLRNDAETVREFHQLSEQVAAGDAVEQAMTGVVPDLESGVIPDSRLRLMADTAENLREKGIDDDSIRQLLSGQKVTAEEHARAAVWKRNFLSDRERTAKYLAGDAALARELTLCQIIENCEIAEASK